MADNRISNQPDFAVKYLLVTTRTLADTADTAHAEEALQRLINGTRPTSNAPEHLNSSLDRLTVLTKALLAAASIPEHAYEGIKRLAEVAGRLLNALSPDQAERAYQVLVEPDAKIVNASPSAGLEQAISACYPLRTDQDLINRSFDRLARIIRLMLSASLLQRGAMTTAYEGRIVDTLFDPWIETTSFALKTGATEAHYVKSVFILLTRFLEIENALARQADRT